MKTMILLVMLGNQYAGHYQTKDCDHDMRALSEAMPDFDFYCIAPSYAMRPIARPTQ